MKKNIIRSEIKKYTEMLRLLEQEHDLLDFTITPPHIEEIGGTPDYIYGVLTAGMQITYKGEYRRVNNIMSQWERIDKSEFR